VSPVAVRRDVADLILEALDVAASRQLSGAAVHILVLDVLRAERPDIPADRARHLVERYGRRLNGRAALLGLPQGVAVREPNKG